VSKPIDCAQAYYWDVELIEPADPEDDCYILLHGEEGEIVGPFNIAQAQTWIDRFSFRSRIQRQELPNE
jgi:hypothetical protein